MAWRYVHFTTSVSKKCNRTVQQSTWVSEPHEDQALCKEKYCLLNHRVSYRIERAIFHSANSSPSTELIRRRFWCLRQSSFQTKP